MKKQVLIIKTNLTDFQEETEKLLADGFLFVPRLFQVTSSNSQKRFAVGSFSDLVLEVRYCAVLKKND